MIRTTVGKGKDKYFVFNVHEVFYNKKGQPMSWSEEPIFAQGDNPFDMFGDLCLMQKAFYYPPFDIVKGKLVEVEVNNVTGKNK